MIVSSELQEEIPWQYEVQACEDQEVWVSKPPAFDEMLVEK
jgi:hypothetical protein